MTDNTARPDSSFDLQAKDPLMHALEQRQTMAGLIFAAMSMPRTLAAPERSLPLTIIGGFLGAGKTTLLNRLLSDPGGRRLVVLVNDFGKINIDAALIADQTDDTINLTNGCACCAVSSDLSKSLVEITQRDDRPDAVILETSGVADPGAIGQIALANGSIRLDGILTVVDAETLPDRAADPVTRHLFNDQMSSADMILLSKTDLVDHTGRAAAQDWLERQFPKKTVLKSVEGSVPTEVVLGIGAEHDIVNATIDHGSQGTIGHGFESVSIEIGEPLDEAAVRAFLSDLPDNIMRAKGFVSLAQAPDRRTIFQRVGRRWSLAQDNMWPKEERRTSLVFIGPHGALDRDRLLAELKDCVED
ncbi:GTP-binding protein [uncultured Roseibium sp.]|uniref:CobW family GTP-binding protein n=1 Tax=uncultured Roseibium sp. TaxID=1936171 RepID=UPI00261B84F9|nr:GTP-binding protein [uncultured Roseibium sp.]